jgi:hypothetical protein
MCCFSQPVELVADTSIFARIVNGRQFLVYSMRYAAAGELAMVLPLPVPPGSSEDAVRFIDLQGYLDFFEDMSSGFPRHSLSRSVASIKSLRVRRPTLKVHDVGDFEASFVPGIADFDRLDERFRIPRQVWDQLPSYSDFGFAVFKLKPAPAELGAFLRQLVGARRKARRVHPMAFEFPSRNPDVLYFPTLHIHDRAVHEYATFDHLLYCQPNTGMEEYLIDREQSYGPAADFMDVRRTEGIVLPSLPCWRLPLKGKLRNTDVLLGKKSTVPVA